MIEACAWSVQCYVVNINHVLPLGSWITGLCEFSSPFCILEWSWCVRLDCQYLRLVTRRTSPLTSAFRSVILGRRRWWSDRFSGSGHSWQSWRSMAANSLKPTLPSLQSTKVPRELVLITENEGENFVSRASRGMIGAYPESYTADNSPIGHSIKQDTWKDKFFLNFYIF